MNEERKTLTHAELVEARKNMKPQMDIALNNLDVRLLEALDRRRKTIEGLLWASEASEMKKKIFELQTEYDQAEIELERLEPSLTETAKQATEAIEIAMSKIEANQRIQIKCYAADQSKITVHENLVELRKQLSNHMTKRRKQNDQ